MNKFVFAMCALLCSARAYAETANEAAQAEIRKAELALKQGNCAGDNKSACDEARHKADEICGRTKHTCSDATRSDLAKLRASLASLPEKVANATGKVVKEAIEELEAKWGPKWTEKASRGGCKDLVEMVVKANPTKQVNMQVFEAFTKCMEVAENTSALSIDAMAYTGGYGTDAAGNEIMLLKPTADMIRAKAEVEKAKADAAAAENRADVESRRELVEAEVRRRVLEEALKRGDSIPKHILPEPNAPAPQSKKFTCPRWAGMLLGGVLAGGLGAGAGYGVGGLIRPSNVSSTGFDNGMAGYGAGIGAGVLGLAGLGIGLAVCRD